MSKQALWIVLPNAQAIATSQPAVRLSFLTYTRTAWGWSVATIYGNQRYHAQADTKQGAAALLREIVRKAVQS